MKNIIRFTFPYLIFLSLSVLFSSGSYTDPGLGVKLGMFFPEGMPVEGSTTRYLDSSSSITVGVDLSQTCFYSDQKLITVVLLMAQMTGLGSSIFI